MPRCLTWYYRKFRTVLAHFKWLINRQAPNYHEGERVIVRFNSSLYGPEEVLCRICSITYRFYSLTYDVIMLEDKGWLSFGTRTFVFPENIVRQPALQKAIQVMSSSE